MIKIITYWNKVIDDSSSPFGTKVLKGEYEIKSQYRIDNTLDNLKTRYRECNHPRMKIEKDQIIEDMGTFYGIHSYTVIEEA